MLDKKFIISPPFGNHIEREWAYSVKGSYTVNARPGLWWAALKTFRKHPGGWVNKIGLKNEGIYNIEYKDEHIYSFAPLKNADYLNFISMPAKHVEINISCPNAKVDYTDYFYLKRMVERYETVIVKLPPMREQCRILFDKTYDCGVKYFHLCNTYPTLKGGISGKELKTVSLRRIELLKRRIDDITIIGGGGIYTKQDLIDYQNAGADIFSLSTVWLTPWRVKNIIK